MVTPAAIVAIPQQGESRYLNVVLASFRKVYTYPPKARIAESQHVTLLYALVTVWFLNRLTNHNYTSHSGSKVNDPDDLRLGRTATLRLHASSASSSPSARIHLLRHALVPHPERHALSADALTKALPAADFRRHVQVLLGYQDMDLGN